MITETILKTEQGKRHLRKLCQYFSRQVPATIIGLQGRFDMPFGLCRIQVTDQHLYLHLEVDNDQDIDEAERIVAKQLSHITCNNKSNLQWKRQN